MKATRIKDGRSGLTVIEVLVILAVIGLLAAVVLPRLAKAKGGHSPTINCVRQLKSVSLALRIWANDNGDRYPMQVPDAQGGAEESVAAGNIVRIFQVMSNELSVPKSVVCPSEWSLAATNWAALQNSNISYFVGLDAEDFRPNTILSGDRDIAENGQLLRGAAHLTTNRPVAWHTLLHKEGGNVALADGSVQQTTTATLRSLLANTGDTTNRVLFPQ
jgi:prepilin-type processing-associated H-X9-DG protein